MASRGPWALDMLRLLPPLLRHCPQVASHKGDPDSRFLGAGGKRPGVWGRAGHPDVAPAPSSWETPSSLGTPALRGALREVPAEPAGAGETVTTRRDTPRHRGLFPWPEGHVGTAHLWFPQVSPQRWNLNSDTGSQGSRPRRWRGVVGEMQEGQTHFQRQPGLRCQIHSSLKNTLREKAAQIIISCVSKILAFSPSKSVLVMLEIS